MRESGRFIPISGARASHSPPLPLVIIAGRPCSPPCALPPCSPACAPPSFLSPLRSAPLAPPLLSALLAPTSARRPPSSPFGLRPPCSPLSLRPPCSPPCYPPSLPSAYIAPTDGSCASDACPISAPSCLTSPRIHPLRHLTHISCPILLAPPVPYAVPPVPPLLPPCPGVAADWVKSYRPDLASHQFDPIRIRAPRQIPEEYRDVHIPSEEELQMLAQFGHAHHASYYFNTKPAAAMAAAAEAAAGFGVGDQKP
ncbi:unnamed protein product [Closterium sp. NIES-53]